MDYKEIARNLEKASEWVQMHGRNTNTAIGTFCREGAKAIIELQEREPVHAHWEMFGDYADRVSAPFRCSKCGRYVVAKPVEVYNMFPYCNCGARMYTAGEEDRP